MAFSEAVKAFVNAETVSDALMQLSVNFEGLQYDVGKAEDDIFYTDPPFYQLAEYASHYGEDYDTFIDDIERAKDTLVYIPPFDDDSQDQKTDLWKHPLHLMTALRAKGKEFDTVVLLDVIDGIWPSKNATTPLQTEAERRIFYVAFTRARERVLLLVPKRIGRREANSIESPFIRELGL
ncbi:MAG: ATP-binding domain-containing protein [Chloroflexi bacterium]|nr:ATP-binding domain-containing protein [Chloroflexota bacterium]